MRATGGRGEEQRLVVSDRPLDGEYQTAPAHSSPVSNRNPSNFARSRTMSQLPVSTPPGCCPIPDRPSGNAVGDSTRVGLTVGAAGGEEANGDPPRNEAVWLDPPPDGSAAGNPGKVSVARGSSKKTPEKKEQEDLERLHQPRSPLVDIGANLTHHAFRANLGEVLQRASDAGIGHIIVTGTSLRNSREGLELCRAVNATGQHGVKLSCTVGVHPHDAGEMLKITSSAEQLARELEDLITANPDVVVAVGETGLDYDRNFSSRADQEAVLELQLKLAANLDMPLFLHERSAHEELRGFLSRHAQYLRRKGVVHCFTSAVPDHATAYLDLGFSIGITGWVCDSRPGRGADLGCVLPLIPLDKIMLETDAPYLIPRNIPKQLYKRFRQNEPSLLGYVLKKVAESYEATGRYAELSLDQMMDKLAAASTQNASRMFRLNL